MPPVPPETFLARKNRVALRALLALSLNIVFILNEAMNGIALAHFATESNQIHTRPNVDCLRHVVLKLQDLFKTNRFMSKCFS